MERHRFNPVSFIFGILFIGGAAMHFISDAWDFGIDGRWLWPTLLVVAGIAVVAGSVNTLGDRERSTPIEE